VDITSKLFLIYFIVKVFSNIYFMIFSVMKKFAFIFILMLALPFSEILKSQDLTSKIIWNATESNSTSHLQNFHLHQNRKTLVFVDCTLNHIPQKYYQHQQIVPYAHLLFYEF
jgi:hypothetical protein